MFAVFAFLIRFACRRSVYLAGTQRPESGLLRRRNGVGSFGRADNSMWIFRTAKSSKPTLPEHLKSLHRD